MPSRPAGSSTGWSATRPARSSGTPSRPGCRPAGSRPWPCGCIVEREREIRAFKPQEYWTIEALCEGKGQTFEASLVKVDGHKPQLDTEADARAVVDAVRTLPFVVTKVEQRRRNKRPGGAVHHQHAPAGGGQEAGLLLPAHHARGPGPLRGHRRRRRGAGRPHHLHADRLGAGRRYRGRRGSRAHRGALRQALPPGAAQQLQRQEERPGAGRPRGDPPDRRAPAPGRRPALPRARPIPALPAHLAALRRVPDDARRSTT